MAPEFAFGIRSLGSLRRGLAGPGICAAGCRPILSGSLHVVGPPPPQAPCVRGPGARQPARRCGKGRERFGASARGGCRQRLKHSRRDRPASRQAGRLRPLHRSAHAAAKCCIGFHLRLRLNPRDTSGPAVTARAGYASRVETRARPHRRETRASRKLGSRSRPLICTVPSTRGAPWRACLPTSLKPDAKR